MNRNWERVCWAGLVAVTAVFSGIAGKNHHLSGHNLQCDFESQNAVPEGIPPEAGNVGDHIRNVHLRRELDQADVAEIFGVTDATVWNWDNHRNSL